MLFSVKHILPQRTIMKNFLWIVAIFLSLSSCKNANDKKLLPDSIGRYNELMLIINPEDWDGIIGQELRKHIEADVPGLPQPEPQFDVTHIPHQGFEGFLKHNRNILSIDKAGTTSWDVTRDVFANNQVYIHIKGNDKTAIVDLLREKGDSIVKIFKEHDLKMLQKRLTKHHYKPADIQFFNQQKLRLMIPVDYTKVDDVKDFIWFRKDLKHYGYNINGSMDIFAYTLPLEVPFSQVKDSINAIRNNTGKKHIPGGPEGSYMITEAAYTPHIYNTTLNGKPAYKVLGKWEIYKDFMAGPFVSYFVYDKARKRLVVVEGVVYAPIVKKRDMIFELDAIIRSLYIEKP